MSPLVEERKPIDSLPSRRFEILLSSRHVLLIPQTQEPKGAASDAPHLSMTTVGINLINLVTSDGAIFSTQPHSE